MSSPLTAELAAEIAADTSRIIGFNVLITDPDAVVIGSGDESRIGSVHEASLEVLRTGHPAWHTAAQAKALRGVRPGITLPIVLDGRPLGTVGITGSPRLVRRFGLLVRRHTEILVREALLLRSTLLREQAVAELVRDIALVGPDVVDAEALRRRAGELGIDLARTRVVAVVEPGSARVLHAAFPDAQDVYCEIVTGRFAVLATKPVNELPGARVGLSDPATGVGELHRAYQDAAAALQLAPAEPGVYPIGALRVPQLLAAAGHPARERFTAVVLGRLRAEPDWPSLRATLVAWAESGFNLVRAAAALHIHRNTLLYRLDKITDRAGRPAREPADALALYLACLADTLDTPAASAHTQPVG